MNVENVVIHWCGTIHAEIGTALCPLCQGVSKTVWVDKRSQDIFNAPYFHAVFTMPQQLHFLIYQNQELLYDLMYKAAAETLSELSLDKKYLGAQIGFFSLLHSWGQDL